MTTNNRVHYVPVGASRTVCNRPRLKVLCATRSIRGITCLRCRQTEAYKLDLEAQNMENALTKPSCPLCKGDGRHPIQATSLTRLCTRCGGTGEAPTKEG